MNDKIIAVIPPEAGLAEKLGDLPVVYALEGLDKAKEAAALLKEKSRLFCLSVKETRPLDQLGLDESFGDLPVSLFLPGIGSQTAAIKKAKDYAKLNIRFYLPVEPAINLVHIRILASIGLRMGFYFPEGHGALPWEALQDLLAYAVYSPSPRGTIAPIENYVQGAASLAPVDFSYAWFDDPARFVHVTREGQVALSAAKAKAGDFLGIPLGELGSLKTSEDYKAALKTRQQLFLKDNDCAYCPAWKVCQGEFKMPCQADPHCRDFFQDLLEAAEHRATKNAKGIQWQ